MPDHPLQVRLILLTGSRVGEELSVEKEALLGRLTDCDLKLEDPAASRHHATVRITGEGVYLEDLGSSNGTKLQGKRIRMARISDGDIIGIGETRIRVRIETSLRAPPSRGAGELLDEEPEEEEAPPVEPGMAGPPIPKRTSKAPPPSPRGRGGALQYHRIEDRGGSLDLSQSGPFVRFLVLLLLAAAGIGLFLIAYHSV